MAREIQTDENAALETPLPFAADRYVKDFTSEGSQLLFPELIERASLITVLPESPSRDAASRGRCLWQPLRSRSWARRLEALALLESFFMVLALGVIALALSMRMHHRWISYRALAERFRLDFFLSVAGVGAEPGANADPPHRMRPYDWMSRSFNEVWISRPRDGRHPFSLDALKRFLAEAWIDDQIDYYNARQRETTGVSSC